MGASLSWFTNFPRSTTFPGSALSGHYLSRQLFFLRRFRFDETRLLRFTGFRTLSGGMYDSLRSTRTRPLSGRPRVPTMTTTHIWAIAMRRRAVMWIMRATISGMVAVVDGHRGIARDGRCVVRRRSVVDGRCDGRCIDRLGRREIAHLFRRQATRQQADEPKQENILHSIHDQPLFLDWRGNSTKFF